MGEIQQFIRTRQKANLFVVAANVLVFIILSIIGDTEDGAFMLRYGADFAPLVQQGEYYRLFTAMFLHFGFEHLIYNMLMLIFLGDILEKHVGKIRYLMIYIGGGLLGNVLSCRMDLWKNDFSISAGASGAVFAVVGALVFIVIRNKGTITGLSGRRLILMAVLSIAQGFTETGIDNVAHIGGFLGGFLIAFLLRTGKRRDSFDFDRTEQIR